jgi:hypothetical protein
MKNQIKSRSKARLSEEDISAIASIIENWEGKLTWESIIERTSSVLNRTYSRQALERHEKLKTSYHVRKNYHRDMKHSLKYMSSSVPDSDLPPELAAERQKRKALEKRVKTLEATVDKYHKLFVVWLYNARMAGLTKEKLNAPLPILDRQRSDGK